MIRACSRWGLVPVAWHEMLAEAAFLWLHLPVLSALPSVDVVPLADAISALKYLGASRAHADSDAYAGTWSSPLLLLCAYECA